jgi:hypothetical protein
VIKRYAPRGRADYDPVLGSWLKPLRMISSKHGQVKTEKKGNRPLHHHAASALLVHTEAAGNGYKEKNNFEALRPQIDEGPPQSPPAASIVGVGFTPVASRITT